MDSIYKIDLNRWGYVWPEEPVYDEQEEEEGRLAHEGAPPRHQLWAPVLLSSGRTLIQLCKSELS